jgi:enoyl-CoA hydratase
MKAIADTQPVDMIHPAPDRDRILINEVPKPLIAAVDSVAVESGCELAVHADITIAGANAKFTQLEVGIVPGAGGTQRLFRAVGNFQAMKLLLTGELISAREAEATGFATEAVPGSDVLDRALALARAIACLPPIAIREIKKLARQVSGPFLEPALMMERHASQLVFATTDQKEGMQSFIEKRSPNFIGL